MSGGSVSKERPHPAEVTGSEFGSGEEAKTVEGTFNRALYFFWSPATNQIKLLAMTLDREIAPNLQLVQPAMTQRKVKVVPAILTDSFSALQKMVKQAEGFTDYVQMDIMDGQFVPSRSISWQNLADLSLKLDWEAHLMVLHPEDYLPGFHRAGARKIFFHYEATPSPRDIIAQARDLGLGVGLAVNPETTVSAVLPIISELDSLLLMTVNPGFYGSRFIPEVMDKVAELRDARPDIEIGVDGGVKENNIAQIAGTGVNVIYVGSAIFLSPQPAESYRRLLTLARGS